MLKKIFAHLLTFIFYSIPVVDELFCKNKITEHLPCP
jgi:hypothetical protein